MFATRPLDPGAKFFASDLLRERLAMARAGAPQTSLQFGASPAHGAPRLVGVTVSQLRASFPNIGWVVAVSQGEDELFAPVRAQAAALFIVLALTVVVVLLLALWYSERLSAPSEPEEMDMHLTQHPRVHRIEEPDEAEPEVVGHV